MSTFKEVIGALNEITPLELAGSWDNVGLLVEPSNANSLKIDRIFLTNDLTENVLDEAIEQRASMIVSYHPPLFAQFKRLTSKVTAQRIAVKAIENHLPVYSPHSALDAINGGINDWTADALKSIASGKGASARPIQASMMSTNKQFTHKVEILLNSNDSTQLQNELANLDNININTIESKQSSKLEVQCSESKISLVSQLIEKNIKSVVSWSVYNGIKYSSDNVGIGRLLTFNEGVSIEQVIETVKKLFGLQYIRLGRPQGGKDRPIKTVAMCAGSGASVILNTPADLYLTGELSHHEILEACSKGNYVIVCDHSNTERGYLSTYKSLIQSKLANVEIIISKRDADPLVVV
ncbi:Hypothetical UPF0135 protein [Heterostelium album PN500]|uniref:NIF3-like protein 1 n=1 Tax=Heterostelium pallidum (strain ATCC 26659 / Pp 5 / PN500) TaxID=670386 RepID=D3BL35_HETP5|nr:Hypothetical UPF0135 protein [Heterostelium album PN500]EFA77769.1 Hypothetical UPF0135 protein [Heterostelium album PN500]|eukprot:XP_020429897.1 Hypothetical UPF0135 protein [Heterostelium album PN500]